MVKVLIIDTNDVRSRYLQDKLAEHGLITDVISMLLPNNVVQTNYQADILLILDQSIELAEKFIKANAQQKSLTVLTNITRLAERVGEKCTLFILSQDMLEDAVVNRVKAISDALRDPRILPIAVDPYSKAALEMARKAAKTNATVLITGETGVGKEVLAHYIHHHSGYAKGPFVSVNCAALPDNMIEAILFGYEKGAFTSAVNNYIGKFEQAQNGTLLLDEISEISIGLQAKLLRVLQEREIERLGGKKTIHIHLRIIAATNRDLVQQVNLGAFRKDLYYRLNVIPMHCAALRERALDIIPLAEFFIRHHANLLERNIPVLTHAAQTKLRHYPWPGNIREMDNVIQRTLIMTEGDYIEERDILLHENIHDRPRHDDVVIDFDRIESKLEANEARVIMDVLKEVAGCRHTAAKKLNISPRTLRYKLAKLRSIGVKVP